MGPAIDNDDSDEPVSEHSDGEETKVTPLMQQINETKLKVTGQVVGVIKKFSKTYGGSILSLDQMLPETKTKLNDFARVQKLSESDIVQHYRVFIPYNTQLPQVLMRAKNPESLENKRLIIRVAKWPISSPFPFG